MFEKKPIEHTTLLLLGLLSSGDMYGYQMITELERRSDQTFKMNEHTLYPVLKKMENSGYVKTYTEEVYSATNNTETVTETFKRTEETETKNGSNTELFAAFEGRKSSILNTDVGFAFEGSNNTIKDYFGRTISKSFDFDGAGASASYEMLICAP